MNSNEKKVFQLGMPQGTASNRLRKSIILMLLKKLNLNFCYQCGEEIEYENDLSVEHKTPWLDSENPIKLFFDLENIAFSHLHCNIRAARKYERNKTPCPSWCAYKRGCRCKGCMEANRKKVELYRENMKHSSNG
jgi:hypothetical protein